MTTKNPNPVHPSRLLLMELEGRDLSPAAAAALIDFPLEELTRVLAAEAPITPALAEALERGLETPASVWLKMQANFDAHPKNTHGGARPGAGRPDQGIVGKQVRVSAPAEQLRDIEDWLASLPKGTAAQTLGQLLWEASRTQRAK